MTQIGASGVLVPTKMVVSSAPAVLAEDSLEQGLQRMTKTASIRTTPSKDAVGLEKPPGAGGAQQLWLGLWAVMTEETAGLMEELQDRAKREGPRGPLV